ncbi:MAG: acylneuraminate cytidylyltransferase family protein [Candidatus Nomurabacteria bacterium]|nr:acylneuraminate cytidylyltransferase family protein [Candidatus Nomurabacteria bacterium]
MKILAIIPARGGSKGIPHKNKINIAGKPLIGWTIEAAKNSKFLNKIVVSSDDLEILSTAQKYKVDVIKRPKKYALDNAPSDVVIFHAIDHLKNKENYVPNIIVILQPTSPLRTSEDIDKAIELFLKNKAGAVISVMEGDNKHLKSFFIEKGFLQGIVNNEFPFTNRQALPKIYMPNGALYVIYEKEFRKEKKLFSKKTIGFLMKKERSIDLDTPDDIPIIESYLK